eukprot:CAMPEP_0194483706 /NCGR_PEP_ID=MMETSP0253-20130528/5229_1 /TAXON_ID=2966 /ORGANISM="Noctiluca scintillans" /LENGTH=636 /DNA_ID=CAMNT_0039323385 /DNA_START=68 /DNA_END=1976 /DNA_ORIENTATION=-
MVPVWFAQCLLSGTLLADAVSAPHFQLAAVSEFRKDLGQRLKVEDRKLAMIRRSAAGNFRKFATRVSRARRLSESDPCGWTDDACSLDQSFASASVQTMPDGEYKDFLETCMVCAFTFDSVECSGTEGCAWNTADEECECEETDLDLGTLLASVVGETSSCGSLAALFDIDESEESEVSTCSELDATSCANTSGCAVGEAFEVVGEECQSSTTCSSQSADDDGDADDNAVWEALCGEGFNFTEEIERCMVMSDEGDLDPLISCLSDSCTFLGTLMGGALSCLQFTESDACQADSRCTWSAMSCEGDSNAIFDFLFANMSDSCVTGQLMKQSLACSEASTEAACAGDCSWQTSWSCGAEDVVMDQFCELGDLFVMKIVSNSDVLDQDEKVFMELMYTGAECDAQTSESDCGAVTSEMLSTDTSATTTSATTTSAAAAAVVSGSLQLTISSDDRADMCEDTKLAVDGDTWVVVVTSLTNSGVAMTGVSVGPLTCSDVALLRGRRLQDASLELSFEATFSDDTSASSFSNEVEANSATLVSEFETQAASDLGVTVSATLGELTVTSADDSSSNGAGSTTLEEATVTTTVTSTDDSFSNGAAVRGTLLGTFSLAATAAFLIEWRQPQERLGANSGVCPNA